MIAKRTKTAPRPRQRPGFEIQLPGFRNQLLRDGAEDPCQSADEQRGPGQIMPRFLQFQRRLPVPWDQIHGGFLVSFARHQNHRPRGSESLSNSLTSRESTPRPLPFCSLAPVFLIPDPCSLIPDPCSLIPAFTPPPYLSVPPLPLLHPTPYLPGPSVPQSLSPEVPAFHPPPPLHSHPTPQALFFKF